MLLKGIVQVVRRGKTNTFWKAYNLAYGYNEKNSDKFNNDWPGNLMTTKELQMYSRPLLPTVDPQCKDIIELMMKSSVNTEKVSKMMHTYLDYRASDIRKPESLLLLSVALQNCSLPSKNMLIINLGEWLNRFLDIHEIKFDINSLMSVLDVLMIKLNSSNSKTKKMSLKYLIIQMLKINIGLIEDKDIYKILKILLILRGGALLSERLRFISLSSILEKRFTEYLKKENYNYYNKQAATFLRDMLSFYKFFQPKDQQSVDVFYQAVERIIFQYPNYSTRFFLFSFYIYFPYSGKTKEGIYYKDKVLDLIKMVDLTKLYKQISPGWNSSMLCYSILSFSFYKHMSTRQFRYGQFNYLLKQDVNRPELDQHFWEWYQKDPSVINGGSQILHNVIRNLYSERYIKSSEESITRAPNQLSQNEIRARITMALQRLGLKTFKSEVEVCGRYVDFILEDNIILECDGDYHFNVHRMEYTEQTEFRNLHLLLQGYRLILINIFQYNENRYSQEMTDLIGRKLQFMKKNGAVLVI